MNDRLRTRARKVFTYDDGVWIAGIATGWGLHAHNYTAVALGVVGLIASIIWKHRMR